MYGQRTAAARVNPAFAVEEHPRIQVLTSGPSKSSEMGEHDAPVRRVVNRRWHCRKAIEDHDNEGKARYGVSDETNP
jgi:hypothetical protein